MSLEGIMGVYLIFIRCVKGCPTASQFWGSYATLILRTLPLDTPHRPPWASERRVPHPIAQKCAMQGRGETQATPVTRSLLHTNGTKIPCRFLPLRKAVTLYQTTNHTFQAWSSYRSTHGVPPIFLHYGPALGPFPICAVVLVSSAYTKKRPVPEQTSLD